MRTLSTPSLTAYARLARRRPPSAPPMGFEAAVVATGAGWLLSRMSPKLGTTKKSTPRELSAIKT